MLRRIWAFSILLSLTIVPDWRSGATLAALDAMQRVFLEEVGAISSPRRMIAEGRAGGDGVLPLDSKRRGKARGAGRDAGLI